MPKAWDQAVEGHRRQQQDTILDATGDLVAEAGIVSLNMSDIAERSGIGRATLYRYFPDVEHVLSAWHQRAVSQHLAELEAIRDRPGPAVQRLIAVLSTYAAIRRDRARHSEGTIDAVLHSGSRVDHASGTLETVLSGLITEAAKAGQARGDVPAPELARYCLRALDAAADSTGKAATARLVTVVCDGLQISRAAI